MSKSERIQHLAKLILIQLDALQQPSDSVEDQLSLHNEILRDSKQIAEAVLAEANQKKAA